MMSLNAFMKHKHIAHSPEFASIRSLVFILCALCALYVKTNAQDFKQLHPGVEHAQVDHKLGPDPVKINLLRLDLRKVRLDVHHALDKAVGLETTSSIAKRKGAVAAINAGFFRLDKSEFAGEPAGILILNGKVISEEIRPRTAMLIFNTLYECTHCVPIHHTSVSFERLRIMSNTYIGKNDLEISVDGINRERKATEVVMYTRQFGTVSPAVKQPTLEIVIDGDRIKNVFVSQGQTRIPKSGYVLAADDSEESRIKNALSKSRKTFQVLVPFVDRDPTGTDRSTILYRRPDHAVGGVPQLVKSGKIDITWEQEKAGKAFTENRHPRTAVAKLKDGKFLMVTVDGRQPGVSVGMSLQELAEYLFSLGAVDAMNLDGGGSTTMFLDGKVVNTPSDKEGERKIGDAILVTLRKKK